MLASFSLTCKDFGLLLLRAAVGSGMAYHGYGKVFGGMMPKFIEGVNQMGFPYPDAFAWAAALSELLGGILIVVGFLTRPSAFMVAATMSVAAFMAHASDPFAKKELALAYLITSVYILLAGAGRWSLDEKLKK